MSNVSQKRLFGRLVLVLLALLVTVVVLIGVLVAPVLDAGPAQGSPAAEGTGGADLKASSALFNIGGNATESISPGVMAPLDLRLTNPHEVPMSVAELSVTLKSVSAPNADNAHPCSIGDFTVAQAYRGVTITVAGRATSTLSGLGLARSMWPTVGMLERSVNQDGCKGASLTLAYAATGTLALS
jgi:hypothetical protein